MADEIVKKSFVLRNLPRSLWDRINAKKAEIIKANPQRTVVSHQEAVIKLITGK